MRAAANAANQTPLELTLALMRGVAQPLALRVAMAKAAAPYVHPKLQSTDNKLTTVDPNKSSAELRAELPQMLTDLGLPPDVVKSDRWRRGWRGRWRRCR
jgi:hypothetical protein